MKQDIEWLKEQVNDYLDIEGVEDARMALKAVLDYIDELDEPEVLPQKYNVKFKVKSSSGTVGIFLYKLGDEVLAGDNFKVYYPEGDKFRLTEQEIKDFDPRCWPFAEPVD